MFWCARTTLARLADVQHGGKIGSFPSATQLRTAFIERDIQGELSDLSVLDYMFADEILKGDNIPKEEMAQVLKYVGFHQNSPPTSPPLSVPCLETGRWSSLLPAPCCSRLTFC
jgi:hypothetical protein